MSTYFAKFTYPLACSFLATGLTVAISMGPALAAEQTSVDQIINALTPKTLTRSLTTSPAQPAEDAEETRFLDSLRNRTTRSLTVHERDELGKIDEGKAHIDREIDFEYNSAKLTPAAISMTKILGEALSSPALKGSTFVIEGHTDGKGGKAFNQKLSEQRADAVKRFLVENYKIPASTLVTVGYGKDKLKNKDDPFAAENRRVRVVNMTSNLATK